jgi:hypothetical protein
MGFCYGPVGCKKYKNVIKELIVEVRVQEVKALTLIAGEGLFFFELNLLRSVKIDILNRNVDMQSDLL